MDALESTVDVAVIGAGAAGLAAARALAGHPLTVQVLEARDRIGGRAFTQGGGGFPLDLGCGWLHSADRNPFVASARELGFTVDETPPPWERQSGDQGFPAADQAAWGQAFAAFEDRIAAAAREPGDRAAGDLLDPADRWSPLIDAVGAYINGAEYGLVSVRDYDNYLDTEVNWRVTEGYGAMIRAWGADVPVALACPVSLIDRSGPRLVLTTARGPVEARAVIVAVPTPVLAQERLRFDPPLPGKAEAADGLPLGLADKLVLELDKPGEFPEDGNLMGRTDSAETGAYHLRPFGRPLIEGFYGGRLAWGLEAEGPAAFEAFALEELCSLLGSGFRRRARAVSATAWGADEWSRGAYSYARPGRAGERRRLAEPVEGRIFFAGEACSTFSFSTAHGARETGEAAARAVLEAMGPARAEEEPRR